MTKNFDTLLESMLAEMMPATMMDDMGTMTSKVTKKIEELPGKSQHWGPLQKLSPETRGEIVKAIIKNVFADNDENTYSTTIDNPEQLKDAVKTAIKTVAEQNPEFKASGKWAVQFLADRLANKELLGNVKYTTMSGDDILQKDATQKEIKQALRKALEQAPAKEEAAVAEEPEQPEKADAEVEKEVETVYVKAADLNSDDSDLQKAFKKLPDDKEMSWEEVLKSIGMTKGMALIDAGGLSEIEKEKEVGEEEDVQALEFDDEDTPDLSNFDKLIDPYFSTTKGSYSYED
jgi:hypothetical protein